MMAPKQADQAALFYKFSLERHVPASHLLRNIDRFVDLSVIRSELAPYYSSTGRPSIDPELLVRMLLVGYCYGIRSERRCARRSTSILPIAGSADLASTERCQIIRPSQRTDAVASVTAICCASCSRRWCGAAWHVFSVKYLQHALQDGLWIRVPRAQCMRPAALERRASPS
jgi:hypothetical protein